MTKFYVDPNTNRIEYFVFYGDSPPVSGFVGYTAEELSVSDDWVPDFEKYWYHVVDGAIVQSDIVMEV